MPEPLIGDDFARWLPARVAEAWHVCGIKTLAEVTVRIPRRCRWWAGIPGLGATGARQVEAFFASHPQLTDLARALVVREAQQDIVPWERIVVPEDVDSSNGTFCAPRATCTLSANNDYEAVHAWHSLHDARDNCQIAGALRIRHEGHCPPLSLAVHFACADVLSDLKTSHSSSAQGIPERMAIQGFMQCRNRQESASTAVHEGDSEHQCGRIAAASMRGLDAKAVNVDPVVDW